MAAVDETNVVADRASAHVLMCAGVFFPGFQALMHAKFGTGADGVALNVVVRSESAEVADLVVGSIARSKF